MKVSIAPARGDGHEYVLTGPWRDLVLPDLLSKPSTLRRVKTIVGWRGKKTFVIDSSDVVQLRCHGESSLYIVCFN